MQCVILAGGLGTRMKTFTTQIPKSLIQIHGHPFIKYQLDFLVQHGVTDALLCIGYKGEMIRDYLAKAARSDIRVDFVDEGSELKGTAGALRLAFEAEKLQSRFIILYGDSYLPIDIRKVWNRFVDGPEPALMTVIKNEERWDASNACFDGRKVTLYEKGLNPKPAKMTYIDYGLTALERSIVESEIPAGRSDLAEVFHRLSTQGRLAGYLAEGRFFEIGSPGGLENFVNYMSKK
jgi:MurNAc alpha-1-phosphate uridylyltransferase